MRTSKNGHQTREIFLVGIGGTLRPGSTTERAVEAVLAHARAMGARTAMFSGKLLNFPMYDPSQEFEDVRLTRYLEAIRSADGIVIGSPSYHGAISGLVKNALDYVEELSADQRPYFDGRAIGCVATGSGWQGTNATLASLRSISHALRGWPSPLGLALNSSQPLFDETGACLSAAVDEQFHLMASQLVSFGEAIRGTKPGAVKSAMSKLAANTQTIKAA
jgi:FMN reductase